MVINYRNLFKLIVWICTMAIIIYAVFHHLFPFAISVIIAVMINPIVQLIQDKLHLKRKLSVLLVLLLILFSFITFITFSMVELVHLLQYLTNIMPTTIEDLFTEIEYVSEQFIERTYQFISTFINSVQPQSQQLLKELITETVSTIKDYSQHILINFLQSTMNSITNILRASYFLLFILISTFFISADGPKWLNSLSKSMPDSMTSYYQSIKNNFLTLVKKYAIAQLIIVFITGSIVYIGLTFFDVRHALAIASVAIILDLIPFIGISALFIPWLLFLFLTNNYTLTIEISILLIILIITRNIVEPKLIGSSIGIHPLALIIILFVFIKFFGLIGFLLGPIAAVSIKALAQAGAFNALKEYIFKMN